MKREKRNVIYSVIFMIVLVLASTGFPALKSYGAAKGTSGQEDTQDKGPGVSWVSEKAEDGQKENEAGEKVAAVGTGTAEAGFDPKNLQAAKDADQLIVAIGTGGCNADVFYFKKAQDDSWNLVWKEAGIVGRNGISQDKKEGDGKTPAGTYGFTMAFGLLDNPGTILSYHKVRKGDVWVDDPASSHYNKLVKAGEGGKDWNSAEGLASASPYYNYVLAMNYNEDCVPGKGSAIFLHCLTAQPDNGSAGCIRLPEERVKELLRSVTDKSRIVISRDISSLQ